MSPPISRATRAHLPAKLRKQLLFMGRTKFLLPSRRTARGQGGARIAGEARAAVDGHVKELRLQLAKIIAAAGTWGLLSSVVTRQAHGPGLTAAVRFIIPTCC